MFEWSKYVMKKIENGESLDERELRQIEVALRMYDLYERALDECLGLEDRENIFQLTHGL